MNPSGRAAALLLAIVAVGGLCGCDSAPAHSQGGAVATTYDADGDFPPFTAPVVDAADLIPYAAEQRLNAKLIRLQRLTTDQLAIVTIPALNGEGIETYSLRLFRKWGLGLKGRNNGVGLIIAPTERKVRIEVGTGLEATLTNEKCARIIAKDIMPHFRAGDIPAGIEAGANAIVGELL